jgi:predicted TIM-barrel fold metal-dependent hydrolase
VRKELAHLPKPPSSYLRRFYYDTIAHDDQTLLNLIAQVGADRVLMGSDCPADMSYTRPVDVVERLSSQGAEPVGNTPEEFTAFVRSEISKWATLVKAANMRAD